MSLVRFFCLALSGMATLSACAYRKPDVSSSQTAIDQEIMTAAKAIEAAQNELYHAGAGCPLPQEEGGRPVTIGWQGDARGLIEKTAQERGLTFVSQGVRLPLPVDIDVRNMPFGEFLDRVRAQIGYRAQITETSRKLILQYGRS
jgi:defect-in-organelle-trafficking protein DotD